MDPHQNQLENKKLPDTHIKALRQKRGKNKSDKFCLLKCNNYTQWDFLKIITKVKKQNQILK